MQKDCIWSNKKIFNYLTLIIVIITFAILILTYIKNSSQNDIYNFIGLLLMAPSIVFFTISRIQLGSSFQLSAKANKLVTKGIYKKIRHPIYFFGLIFILGIIIFFKIYYLIIIWVALILLQLRRIKNEEKILEEKFGEKYLAYKKDTWF